MHLSGALIPIVGNGIHWGVHDSSWIRFANESGLGAGRAHALLQGPLSLCFLVKWLQTPRLLFWSLAGAIAACALGFFDKFDFVWFIVALVGATLIVYGGEIRAKLKDTDAPKVSSLRLR